MPERQFDQFQHPNGGAAQPLLQLEAEAHQHGLLIRVAGEVDLANAQRLREAIEPALHSRRNVILDATHLGYMDLTGFRVLGDASAQLQRSGCRLVLVGVPLTVQKIMRIAGLDKVVPMVASVDEATATLGEDAPPHREMFFR
jgi:anti-sigma B factor antagonist